MFRTSALSIGFATIVATSLFSAGCSSAKGFDRGGMKHYMAQGQVQVTDADIERIFNLKPQLQFPIRLGVYYKNSGWGTTSWTGAERDQLFAKLETLKEAGIVEQVFPISQIVVSDNTLKGARLAAARYHADALLVITAVDETDRYENFAASLYCTILGAFFVPGTEVDALYMVSAALWDVRNEFLYLTVEAEGEASDYGAAFVLEDAAVAEEAKKNAVDAFHKELMMRLSKLVENVESVKGKP